MTACGLLWPQCHKARVWQGDGETLGPGDVTHQDVPTKVPSAPQGSLWGSSLSITYRFTFLPLWATKSCGPPCALGRKDENER